MDKAMRFEIVTPERTVLKEMITEATIPTELGDITVLPRHTPLISFLKPGVLVLRKVSGEREVAFVAGGFVEVLKNKIVVLADTAERAEEINVAKVEEARRRAEEAITKLRSEDAAQFAEVSAQLERELAKTRAIKKWKNIKAY